MEYNNEAILFDLENQDDTFDGKKIKFTQTLVLETENAHDVGLHDRERTMSICSDCLRNDQESPRPDLIIDDSKIRRHSRAVILPRNEGKNKSRALGRQQNEDKRTIMKLKSHFYRTASKKKEKKSKPRSLGRRSSVENFCLFGLLTPALVLLPQANGADALTGQFTDLKGENRELKLAAAHIEDALSGRGKYGKARSYFKSKSAQRCFKILHNLWYHRMFLAAIIVHAVLIFLESPSVDQRETHETVYIINGLCVALYIFDVFIHVKFLNWNIFWSLKTVEGYWNGVQFVLVCMYTVDFIILIVTRFVNVYIPQPFRCLRLVMLLCKVRSIRHIFAVLTTIGTRLLKVFFIILVFIAIFASVGIHLFMDVYNTISPESTSRTNASTICCIKRGSDEGTYVGAFDHIGNAMLRLFVLLSTENYPEIMLPALRKNQANFLFFGVFLFVGIFLLAILLAIVVDSYWVFARKHVKKERARERAELAKAWNLLDPLGLGSLSVYDEQFQKLFRILKPKNTDDQNQALIELLDSNLDNEVDSFEWTTLLRQALQAEFEEDPCDNDSECDSDSPRARIKEFSRRIVQSTVFSKTMLFLIFLHCTLFALRWKGQPSEVELVIQATRSCIVAIFLFETILRTLSLGKAVLHVLEITDVVLVFIAVLFNVLWYISSLTFAHREYSVTVSSLVVFLRLFLNSAETRKAFYWFLSIAPVMVDLMILLLVIMYLLSVIGMELFHSYPLSKDSQIYPDNCGLGFKTFYCSFLAQFQMLTTSNWHEIMNMVAKETKSEASYLYFCLSYILITMTVMNLFTAIAIEAANKLALSHEELQSNAIYEQNKVKKPKERAKKALHILAEKIFASARIQDIYHRDGRGSVVLSNPSISGPMSGQNTIILQSPRKSPSSVKKYSVDNEETFTAVQMEEVYTSESSESVEEDYSGLEPRVKREKQLKRRMRRKRRERRHREREEYEAEERAKVQSPWFNLKEEVRVVTAFKGTRDTDLPLTVGDAVVILEKNDEWLRGESKGKIGWFPASHVVSWATKPSVTVIKAEMAEVSNEVVVAEESSPVQNLTVEEFVNVREDVVHLGNSLPPTVNRLPITSYGIQHPMSPSRPRLKMKMAGDWTRNILGELTVMNADEMRELNKVMRAEMKAPVLVGRGRTRNALGFLGSVTSLSQRDHGSPKEEHSDVESLYEGPRGRSDTTDTQRRVYGSAFESLAKLHSDVLDVTGNRGGEEAPIPSHGSLPKRPKSPLRPVSATQPSRPVTPTGIVGSPSRQRAHTTSSGSHAEPSSPMTERPAFEFVVSVDTGTPSPPNTLLESDVLPKETTSGDDEVPNGIRKGHLKVDLPPISEGKPASKKKKKEKNTGGEMPIWMRSFVASNNLVVADDVKLEKEA